MNLKTEKEHAHLIVQTAFIGDCILSFPLIEKISKSAPEKTILVLCRKGLGKFIESYFRNVKALEVVKNKTSSYKSQLKLIQKNYSIGTIFCPHRSMRSLLFTLKLHCEERIYFSSYLNMFFGKHIKRDPKLPEAVRLLQLFGVFQKSFQSKIDTWKDCSRDLLNPSTPVPNEFQYSMDSTQKKSNCFSLPSKYIVLSPGSVWNTKKWPQEKYADLASLINKNLEIPVVILGSSQERDAGKYIKDSSPNVIDLTDQTSLIDCGSIIQGASGFVGNDSGLLHMAAIYNVPSVGVFGPTHYSLGFKPWQNYAQIASLNLSCSPCGSHGGHTCPLKTHACMRDLSHGYVFKTLSDMIQKKESEI